MKKHKVKYTNESIGKIKIVEDFLPSPENLVAQEETIKITLVLTRSSVDFFKEKAEKYGTQYQKMIRALLERYTQHYHNE